MSTPPAAGAEAGVMVIANEEWLAAKLTVTVAVVVAVTLLAVTSNWAFDSPAPKEIFAGTLRLALEEVTASVSPPAGAAGDTST
jgi:hypothetical protein